MTDQPQTPANPPLPPVKIAFVIDGTVVDVLHTDERLAAIFLSEPTILDATQWIADHPNSNLVGGTYDGTDFTPAKVDPPAGGLSLEEALAQAIDEPQA